MPNPTLLNLQEKWKRYFLKREIEHEEFFITDLKNVESGGNFQCFFKLLEA
jgi:hypothetical protein